MVLPNPSSFSKTARTRHTTWKDNLHLLALSIHPAVAPASIPPKNLEGCVTRATLVTLLNKCLFRYNMSRYQDTKHQLTNTSYSRPAIKVTTFSLHLPSISHGRGDMETAVVVHSDPHPATNPLQQTWTADFLWQQNLSK